LLKIFKLTIVLYSKSKRKNKHAICHCPTIEQVFLPAVCDKMPQILLDYISKYYFCKNFNAFGVLEK